MKKITKKVASLIIAAIFMVALMLPQMSYGQEVIMSNTTLTTCGGIFFDTGGPNANYSANESITMTLCADGISGTHVQLIFLSPQFGGGDDLCFFDGLDDAAPQLSCASDFEAGDSFIIQATAANPTGCLTIVFNSDGTGESTGWGADLNCIAACQNIFAELTSTDPVIMPVDTGYMDVCQGERVFFNAQGLYPQNGVVYEHSDFTSEFHWDFGDGATSVGPNASHIYNTEEGFTVQLTIIDQFGCKNLNSINQRVRVSTTPEFNLQSVPPICVGDTINLGGTVDTVHYEGHNVSSIPIVGTFVKDPIVCDSLPLPDGTGVAYTSTINYTQFSPGAILTDINDLISVFINMEHSWLRDLEVSITCPDGTTVILHDHPGNFGGEVFLGSPEEGDTGANPMPGEGWDYWWTPNSTNGTWLEYANANNPNSLPSMDYEAFGDLSDFIGCPLNGNWTISVEDLWGADNGYIFCWGVEFASHLFPEIETYTPGIDTFGWAYTPLIFEQYHLPPLDSVVTTPANAGTAAFTFFIEDSFGCRYEEPLTVEVLPSTHPDCHNCDDNVSIPNDVVICQGDTVQFDLSNALELDTEVTFESVPYYQFGFANHPPGDPYNSTINVNSVAPLQIANATAQISSICFDIETDYDGDIQIFLQAPSGEMLELTTGNGGSGDNFINTCFTPSAATPINSGSAPFTGEFQPEGDWSILNGADMVGSWTLLVGDQFGINEMGTLNSWSITFNSMNSLTYNWSPPTGLSCIDCPDPEANPTTSTSYIVESEDQYGCLNVDTIQVDVVSEVPAPDVLCASIGNGQMAFTWVPFPNVTEYDINVTVNNVPQGWQIGVTDNPYIVSGLSFGDEVTFEISVSSSGTGLNCDVAIGTTTCTYSECGVDDEIIVDSVVINNVACFGTDSGSATVYVSNGYEPYNYAWDDPDQQLLATAVFLTAGTYHVTITDNVYCMTEVEVVITEPDLLTAAANGEDASCFGFLDGQGTATPGGGTEPYAYVWDNGEITQVVTNLDAGNHMVEVTDANGCVETANLVIGEPTTAVSLTASQSFEGCDGENGNEATVIPEGGTGPNYTYLWTDNQPGQTAIGLNPGTIGVTVTDENGCSAEGTVDLVDLEPLFGELIISEPTCHGITDGSLGVNNFGGGAGQNGVEADYSFAWSNNDSGVVADNLAGGATYYVTIEDANGCSTVVSRFLTDPDPLEFDLQGEDAHCHNGNDGTGTVVNVLGNQGAYTVLWDATAGNQDSITAINLPIGTYYATLTDENGCTGTNSVIIDQPTELVISYATVDNKCFGDAIGTIETSISGGTPGYSYLWPNQAVSSGLTELPAGIYDLQVTDESGCVKLIPIEINQPEPLLAEITVEDVSCNGDRDGTIFATPQGGVPPYQFSLDNTDYVGSSTLIGLTAGSYNVFMKDANDCRFLGEALISEPDEFMVDAGPDVTINLGESIQIWANSENGAPTVSYVWYAPYDSTLSCQECLAPIFFPESTIIYELYGVDQKGCEDTDLLTITVAKPRSAVVPTGFTPNGDGVNDILQVHGLPGTIVKVFRVFDRWGELLFEGSDFEVNSGIGWDGTFKGESMQGGVYLWSMSVEYPFDQETAEFMGETTLIR
jgi:gliding motility-associated-like protein